MKIIGITGGIGCGKTTVCKIFEQLGVPVFYADEAGRRILKKTEIISKVVKLLGEEVVTNEYPDRKKIAEIVFKDEAKLKKLNAIIHPAVQKEFLVWCKKNKNKKYIIKETAILFESGSHKDCDDVITVSSPEKLRIARAMQRDNISLAEVKRKMKRQMADAEKIKRSDFVIKNDEQKLLIPQVLELHKKFS